MYTINHGKRMVFIACSHKADHDPSTNFLQWSMVTPFHAVGQKSFTIQYPTLALSRILAMGFAIQYKAQSRNRTTGTNLQSTSCQIGPNMSHSRNVQL